MVTSSLWEEEPFKGNGPLPGICMMGSSQPLNFAVRSF